MVNVIIYAHSTHRHTQTGSTCIDSESHQSYWPLRAMFVLAATKYIFQETCVNPMSQRTSRFLHALSNQSLFQPVSLP